MRVFYTLIWGNQCGAVRCGSSTRLYGEINAVRCGAGLLHAYMGKSMRCGSFTCLYEEINAVQCGVGLLHVYMG